MRITYNKIDTLLTEIENKINNSENNNIQELKLKRNQLYLLLKKIEHRERLELRYSKELKLTLNNIDHKLTCPHCKHKHQSLTDGEKYIIHVYFKCLKCQHSILTKSKQKKLHEINEVINNEFNKIIQ